jgi:hypothetical protein
MPAVATLFAVVGILLIAVVAGLYGITRVLPRDRDCEIEAKLIPPTVHFSISRNDRDWDAS